MSVVSEVSSRFDVRSPAEFVETAEARGVEMYPRTIACGNPSWNVFSVIDEWVAQLDHESLLLVPDEKGACRTVIRSAVARGVPVAVFPALWTEPWGDVVNRRAGYARTALMLMLGAHELVAFTSAPEPGSPSHDLMGKAYVSGLSVTQIDVSGSSRSFQRQDGASVTFQMLAQDAKFAYEVPDVG